VIHSSYSGQGVYEIKVSGHLHGKWSLWFEGLRITPGFRENREPITTIAGTVVDQAALHGILATIRDINIPLLSVNRIAGKDGGNE
jgi:hypothetical protein